MTGFEVKYQLTIIENHNVADHGSAVLQRKICHGIPSKSSKAVGQTSDIQFNSIIGIFHIKLFVQPIFSAFVWSNGQLTQIYLAIDMKSITADRKFHIGAKTCEHSINSRISLIHMVDIQKK